MHAHVTITRNQPSSQKTEEVITLHRESIIPETSQQPGHQGTLLLVDRANGTSITIDLYETEAHSKATEQSGHDQKQIGKFAHLITAPVVQEVYEVPVYDMEAGSAITHTHVTFGQVQPDKVDEVIKITHDAVMPQTKQQPGYKGTWVLIDRATGKVMGFTLWQTEADMKAAEQSRPTREQIAKYMHLHFSRTLPTQEVFEVAFHP